MVLNQLMMILLFISKVILHFICKYKEIFIYLGKPLIYIQESNQYRSSNNREFECQVYSSSPILVITKKKETDRKIPNKILFYLFRKSVGD
jgi:hypothetical protein